jgi:hypothetical protein
MNKRNIFILLAIFAVLVLAVIIIEGPVSRRGKKKAAKESILFPGFDADQVYSVEIKTVGREVKLSKEDGTWVVATSGNYPADSESVGTMLDKVRDLKSTLTASKSAEKHSQFEVDESGVEVKMLGAEEALLAHFFVGKTGPDFMSTYVRKADKDRVLQVDGYLKSIFDKGTRGWRDRTIFSFDPAQVQRLTLVSEEKGEIAIEALEDGGWQIIKPEVALAEKEAVDGIVRDISKLSADDFAEKKEEKTAEEESTGTEEEEIVSPEEQLASLLKEYELAEPQSKVMVDLKDGTARVLLIGGESGYRYYVKREDKDTVFMVSKGKIDGLFKDLEELKAEVEEVEAAEGEQEAEEAAKPEEESKPQE